MAKTYCLDYGLFDFDLAKALDIKRGGSGKVSNVVDGGKSKSSSSSGDVVKNEDSSSRKEKKVKARVINDIGGDSGLVGGGMGYEYASGGVSMGY